MKKLTFYFSFLVLFTLPHYISAVPATPYPIERTLPDGSKLTVLFRGDEFYNYTLSEDGYLIQENEQGYYNYVEVDSYGQQRASSIRVQPKANRSIEEQILTARLKSFPDMQKRYTMQRAAKEAQMQEKPRNAYPNTGSPKSLVILVNYLDVKFTIANPKQAFTDLLNKEGYAENGGTGSARDYFKTASFGVSSPEFVVVGPFELPRTRSQYGGNNSAGDDENPRNMIIDACKAASAAGVDFSTYDTDNDGIVDNVFVYYAGHNEAEGGPKESIWPHRWQLNTNLTLNGKRVSYYACTSELRGASGENMCGIGTFAHEFGHVYGLVDYYATNNATHHTLSYWNIMDAGAYLNQGRTPPTYSAYDRFYLGWLTPTLLKSPQNVRLPDLKTTNKAYIISATNEHNLNGADPNPVEFILLEYRSRKGWDAFLPRSGMLATRVVYNENTWWNNSPNNDENAMGVDILEADGIASRNNLAGDSYPGTGLVTTFRPTLRSGVDMGKPITYIREVNDEVTFRFMGGVNPPTITLTQNQLDQFNTVFGQTPPQQEIAVSAVNLTDTLVLNFKTNLHFEMRLKDDLSGKWLREIRIKPLLGVVDSTPIVIRYNPQEPSHSTLHSDELMVRSMDTETYQTSLSGQSTRQVYVVTPQAKPASYSDLNGFKAGWDKVFDASGYYLTVYSTGTGKSALTEGFTDGLQLPDDWESSAQSIISTTRYSGNLPPAIELKNNDEFISTETYPIGVDSFFFYVRSIGETNGKLEVEGHDGSAWKSISTLQVGSSLQGRQVFPINDEAMRKFRIRFTKGSSSVSIDDVGVSFNKILSYHYKNEWFTDTVHVVKDINPSQVYFYKVKASDRTLYPDNSIKYENITQYSNTIAVSVQNATIQQFTKPIVGLSVYTDDSGNLQIAVDDLKLIGSSIRIYSANGRLIKNVVVNSTVVAIPEFTKNQIYILQSDNGSLKFRL